MKNFRILYLTFLLLWGGVVHSSEPQLPEGNGSGAMPTQQSPGNQENLSSPFFEANEAFVAGKFKETAAILEKIPGHSFAQYFNLGCAHLKNNDQTKAWIAFEKARQINPHHKALAPAFQKLGLTSQQKKFIPILQTRFYINIIGLFAFIIFWLGIFVGLRRRRKSNSRRFFVYVCYLLFIACIGLLCYANGIVNKCVTVKSNTLIHIAPTAQSGIAEKVPDGTPLRSLGKYGNFINISLGKGKNGWIHCEDVQFILE
jgi:hypothetical protein